MRLAIGSDLHLEFGSLRLENEGADVLILAGDILQVKDLAKQTPRSDIARHLFQYLKKICKIWRLQYCCIRLKLTYSLKFNESFCGRGFDSHHLHQKRTTSKWMNVMGTITLPFGKVIVPFSLGKDMPPIFTLKKIRVNP